MPTTLAGPAELGKLIARARRERGWTQERAAAELGVYRSRLATWERGRSLPPAARLLAVLAGLGVAFVVLSGEQQTP